MMGTRDVSDYRSAGEASPIPAETWSEIDDRIGSIEHDFAAMETSTKWIDDANERDEGSPLDPYTKDLRRCETELDTILAIAGEHDQKRALAHQTRVRALEKQAKHLQRVFEGEDKDAEGNGRVKILQGEELDADDTRKLKLFLLGVGIGTLLNAKCWWIVLTSLGPLFTDPGSEAGATAWGAVVAMVWSYPFTVLGVTRFLYPEWEVWSDTLSRSNQVIDRRSGTIPRGWSIALVVLGQMATVLYTFFA